MPFECENLELQWQDFVLPIPGSRGEREHVVVCPFIDALRSGATICTAEEGRVSVAMCLAAYEFAEAGGRV